MTRQRIAQIKLLRQGLCQSCARPSDGHVHCAKCARRQGHKTRRPPRGAWPLVDWRLSNKEIAVQMDVTVGAVWYQRRKFSKNLL